MNGFDIEVWRAQKDNVEFNNPRSSMITELEKNHLRIGMHRHQVTALLGEPDLSDSQSDTYDIGASAFGVNLERYQITYEKESVMSFRVIRN